MDSALNKKICLSIDILMPTDDDKSVKEYNKISKFKDTQIEIEKIWHLKITTELVIVETLGMIKYEQINKLTMHLPS